MPTGIDFKTLKSSLQGKKSTDLTVAEPKAAKYASSYKSPYKDSGKPPPLRSQSAPDITKPPTGGKKPPKQPERTSSSTSSASQTQAGPTKRRPTATAEKLNYTKRSSLPSSSKDQLDKSAKGVPKGISGYFVGQGQPVKKVQTPNGPPKTGSLVSQQSPRPVGPSVMRKKHDKNDKRRAKIPTGVKFEDEAGTNKTRLRYRYGSISLDLKAIAEHVNRSAYIDGKDTDSLAGEDNDSSDMDPQVSKLDASLEKIRRDVERQEESLNEYKMHRARFCKMFILAFFFGLLSFASVTTWVFKANYGFYHSPDAVLAADRALYVHEWVRVYTNAHMLIMAAPTLHILAMSSLTFRVFSNISRRRLRWIHGTLNFLATVLTGGGVYFAFLCSQLKDRPHFRTLHMVIGLLALIAQSVGLMTGLVFVLPCFRTRTRIFVSPIHKNIGSILLMSDTATIVTGCVLISKNYFQHEEYPQFYPLPYDIIHFRTVAINFVGITTVVSVGMILYLQTNYLYRHRRQPTLATYMERTSDARELRRTADEKREARRGILDEAMRGTRQSFRLGESSSASHKRHFASKTIPILINDTENQKANFTDMDFLLALE